MSTYLSIKKLRRLLPESVECIVECASALLYSSCALLNKIGSTSSFNTTGA